MGEFGIIMVILGGIMWFNTLVAAVQEDVMGRVNAAIKLYAPDMKHLLREFTEDRQEYLDKTKKFFVVGMIFNLAGSVLLLIDNGVI